MKWNWYIVSALLSPTPFVEIRRRRKKRTCLSSLFDLVVTHINVSAVREGRDCLLALATSEKATSISVHLNQLSLTDNQLSRWAKSSVFLLRRPLLQVLSGRTFNQVLLVWPFIPPSSNPFNANLLLQYIDIWIWACFFGLGVSL